MGLSVKPKDMAAFLEAHGFKFIRQNGTSHRIYAKGNKTVPVPMHNKDLKTGTLGQILTLSGLTKKELMSWLGR